MSESAKAFSERFTIAVEGHPHSPPTPHGRQSWFREKLKKEAGLVVSPNSMSKWFRGHSLPRPDTVKKIARVLKVDEVWLTLGRKPSEQPAQNVAGKDRAHGAVLLVAGLVEVAGGRAAFLGADRAPADLALNLDGDSFDVQVVTVDERNGEYSCTINEPTRDSRVLAVRRTEQNAVRIFDITDAPRKSLGGFSVGLFTIDNAGDLRDSEAGRPMPLFVSPLVAAH